MYDKAKEFEMNVLHQPTLSCWSKMSIPIEDDIPAKLQTSGRVEIYITAFIDKEVHLDSWRRNPLLLAKPMLLFVFSHFTAEAICKKGGTAKESDWTSVTVNASRYESAELAKWWNEYN
jgi:hypothetical protein